MGLFDDVLDNVGEEYQGGKGFEYGTHEVIVGEATAKKDTKGREIIEVVVFDEADNAKKASCTLWFHSEGGAKMAVTKVLGILVHNVGEEKKDKVRELGKKLFGAINDPVKSRDVVAKLMQDKLIGKKAYLVVEPRGKYKTSAYGDLWHYAAEPQATAETVERDPLAEDITGTPEADNIPDFGDDL